MKALSLFSGIGGFDLALIRQGHEIIGACEIDEYARQIYGRHFPGVPIHRDATKLDPNQLPDFDILVGGFPCQAFSIAGKRRGFEDTRGTLFFEIARIAKQKRPRYLLLENVKGLLSHERGSTIRTIFQTLDELGYDTQARIINSKDFVPQNRERIFIVGHLRGTGRPEVFPFRPTHNETDKQNLQQIGYIDKNIQGSRVYSTDGLSQTLAATSGGFASKTGLYMLSNTKGNIKQRYQKRDTPWTLDCTGSYMGIEDGIKIRKLTPLECERLQGFPDNWTEGISDTQRYKCCGNAVTVPVVESIISSLVNN